jgi:DinB superfamily
MDTLWTTSLQKQLLATIDMVENALQACPNELWQAHILGEQPPESKPQYSEFWYVLYHCLFWLDFYLVGKEEGFTPPEPFMLDEWQADGYPPRVYTKAELQAYLNYSREKCRTTLSTLTDEQAHEHLKFPWGELTFAELLLDNMRHTQEHGAQLNLFLGQAKGSRSRWKT